MIAALARPPLDESAEYKQKLQPEIDAEQEGLRAGRLGLGAGLAADLYGRELAAFTRGFLAGAAQRASSDLKRMHTLKRAPCDPCTCGGRGLCRDAQ